MVATSTKEELVALTANHRGRIGPLWVFAPLDRDHLWMERLGLRPATWNPLDAVDSCGAASELADHFTAAGKRAEASDHPLPIVKRDRKWNEDGPLKQLVQLFEAWGPADPATADGRKKLSSILFS